MTKNDFYDQFIGDIDADQATGSEMPEGGTLKPTPFIGPAMAGMRWKLGSHSDLSDYENAPPHTATRFDSGWNSYYLESGAHAEQAKELLGDGFIEQTWLWQMDATLVLNAPSKDFAERWGGIVSGECRITSLDGWSRRHEFHMMTLPSFVQAMAQRMGFIGDDIRLFHLDEIIANETVIDDEFQISMIGSTKRPDKGHAKDYQDTILWKRRAELWAALGEDNPEAFAPLGSGHKYETTSDKLSRILGGIRVGTWRKPLWVRLMLIDDPRVEAVSSSDRRLSRPYIMEIFPTETAAHEAAMELAAANAPVQEEIPFDAPPAKVEAVEPDPAEMVGGDTPNLKTPSNWGDYPEMWKTELAKQKAQYGGKMPPPPMLKKISGELEASVDDIKAWWGAV